MTADTYPLPHGSTIALTGLHAACERLDAAREHYLSGKQPADAISTSLSETLLWVAALDEHARNQVGVPGYEKRRGTEQGGIAVGGLCYARNFHTHELLTAGQETHELVTMRPLVAAAGSRRVGPVRVVQLQWTPLAQLPLPKHHENHHRDAMYATAVELRPLTEPVADALAWLQRLPW
jgi:hypothetical protein